MGTDITVVTKELAPVMRTLEPTLEQLLPPGLSPHRLLQTLYVSCANNPSLMKSSRSSLMQAATSAAVLSLEIDGVTGQGYCIPFKGRAQFLSGYKGMCTLAARTGRTLEGFVVRAGDDFGFSEAAGTVHHNRVLGDEEKRKIIAAYAISRGAGLPQMIRVLSIDQLIARRNASAGWKSKGERSTWGTNFDAMSRKSPMRDLSKDLPVISAQAAALQYATAMETMHDMGRHAWLPAEGGIVVDGKERDPADLVAEARDREAVRAEQPSTDEVLEGEVVESPFTVSFDGKTSTDARTAERFFALLNRALDKAEQRSDDERLKAMAELNRARVEALMDEHGPEAKLLLARMEGYQ